MYARRAAINDRAERSARICLRAAALPAVRVAHVVHCYLPIRTEVDTLPLLGGLLDDGRRIIVPVLRANSVEMDHSYLPALDSTALGRGLFGTPAPRTILTAAINDWDIVLVPLLAFDRRGHRLGYGKGYYDRLLARSTKPAYGLAFAAQEVPHIPAESHDCPLDGIITENEVIVFAERHAP
ncbi:5-formyltetrahydrofolate cyclo-ligase [Candidatus Gracilibacteria bacterium]|nr:5-formyltetrahydrofolate cyclo-ligase [Candidatus Gracilibacteria bacterium]